MGECNTILNASTIYGHLEKYCTHSTNYCLRENPKEMLIMSLFSLLFHYILKKRGFNSNSYQWKVVMAQEPGVNDKNSMDTGDSEQVVDEKSVEERTSDNDSKTDKHKVSSVINLDDGSIIGNIKVIKSASGDEELYENIGAMDVTVNLERVDTMEDKIFVDTVEAIEDDYLHNLSFDKNSLLDSGINADELLCTTDGEGISVDLDDVVVDKEHNVNEANADVHVCSKEDKEVELIMKSSDMLDRLENKLRRNDSDERYEDIKNFTKRSRSTDAIHLRTPKVDFARYGISVGIGCPNGKADCDRHALISDMHTL